MTKIGTLTVGLVAATCLAVAVGCMVEQPSTPTSPSTRSVSGSLAPSSSNDAPPFAPGPGGLNFCGGIANFPCPGGYSCVDDPRDSCNPNSGGADCPGICRRDAGPLPGVPPGPPEGVGPTQ